MDILSPGHLQKLGKTQLGEEAAPGGFRAFMLVWKHNGSSCGWDGINPPWAFRVGFPLSVVTWAWKKLEVDPGFGCWEQ